MLNDFAVFILSHGRADNIKTLKMLEDGNYTGDWYIIIDNEDKMADEYYKRYENHVIMFDKLGMSKKIDDGDNFEERRAIVYARNVAFDIAKKLGLKYFLQLDDDYLDINYRHVVDDKLKSIKVKSLDELFRAMIDFLEISGAKTVCFAQGGDLIGGKYSRNFKKGITRKAMNTFFCKTDRRFQFVGKLNEDVSTYTLLGSRGELFFTFAGVSITQVETQQGKGGITEAYKDLGTYVKSFYSVMYMPSCVKVSTIGPTNRRIHHKVLWNNCVPKILNERHKRVKGKNDKIYK